MTQHYTATSLADIAGAFEGRADALSHQADFQKTIKAAREMKAAASAWREAASILRQHDLEGRGQAQFVLRDVDAEGARHALIGGGQV